MINPTITKSDLARELTFRVKTGTANLIGNPLYCNPDDTLYWETFTSHSVSKQLTTNCIAAHKILNRVLKDYGYEMSDITLRKALSDIERNFPYKILLEITKIQEVSLDDWVRDSLLQEERRRMP